MLALPLLSRDKIRQLVTFYLSFLDCEYLRHQSKVHVHAGTTCNLLQAKNLTGGLSPCEAALYEASRRCLQNKNLKLFVVVVVVLCEDVILLAGIGIFTASTQS